MFDWRVFLKRVIPLPQRVILSIICVFGVINAFTMQICLSLTIVDMVKITYHNNTGLNNDDFCPVTNDEDININDKGEFLWSEELQGVILSSFYWGYFLSHIPGGILSEKFGGKWVLGFGLLSTAILTLLTPLAIDTWGAPGLIAIRILEGLGEGTTMPAIGSLFAMWIPSSERGKMGSFVFGASQLGTILATFISAILIDKFDDWRPVFYFFGTFGAVWFFFFILFCSSNPASHPFITEKEKEYLQKKIGRLERDKNLKSPPWKLLITNVPVIVLSLTQLGDFGYYVMVTDLPKYMNDVLHFNIEENGLYSSLPYAMMWIVSIGSGFLSDWIVNKKYISIINSRKLFTTISSAVPGIFIVAASYGGCDRIVVVILFTIAMGTMGTFYAGPRLSSLDLSPNYAGTLLAISNGIGSMTGIIAPYIIGVLTPNRSLSEWRSVFWIAFAVFMITNIIYLFGGSADIQPFNSHYHTESEINKNNNNKIIQKNKVFINNENELKELEIV